LGPRGGLDIAGRLRAAEACWRNPVWKTGNTCAHREMRSRRGYEPAAQVSATGQAEAVPCHTCRAAEQVELGGHGVTAEAGRFSKEETRRGSGCARQVGGDGVAFQSRGRRRHSRVQSGASGAGPGPGGRGSHVLSAFPLLRHPDQPPGRTADPGLSLKTRRVGRRHRLRDRRGERRRTDF
jgi:hypothetical protein